MKYQISLPHLWRHGPRNLHKHPGIYRVPEDIDEALAKRALTEAGAVKVSPSAGAPEHKFLGVGEAADPLADDGPPSPGSGPDEPSSSLPADPASPSPKSKRPRGRPRSSA